MSLKITLIWVVRWILLSYIGNGKYNFPGASHGIIPRKLPRVQAPDIYPCQITIFLVVIGIDRRWITTEFLNDIKCYGMSNHKLRLKCSSYVTYKHWCILWTLKWYTVDNCFVEENVLCAYVVNAPHSGERVDITRMNLILSYANVVITFQRWQSSLCLCFAMTMSITKSQGQTLSNIELYLSRHVFSHSQLYIVVSRVKTKTGFKILIIWL